MSRIDELIAEYCPEGVEFKSLGEVFDMKAGKFISANEISEVQNEDFPYPCYGGNGIRGFVHNNNQDGKYVLIGRQGALCGNVKRANGKFFATEHAVVCDGKVEVDMDWAFHLLTAMNLNQYATKSAQPGLAVRTLEQIKAPLPPIEVQHEIVRVLDKFTKLEAELEAELEARRLQYAYYRDALLSFDERMSTHASISWTTLGNIGKFIRGSGIQKSDFTDSGVGCIHYGQIHTYYGTWSKATKSFLDPNFAARLRKARTGDLVIATTSEDDEAVAKAVAWLGDEDVAVSGDAYIFQHTLNPKYVSYFFQTELFRSQKKSRITGAKVRRMSGESLAKIRIPVPPLEEQARIVAILDKFDALVNDISSGLPAEIKARRQQYEYYRDRLLNFREAA